MGQYKQWLHYRHIDQLLRSQLAVSEHELAQLKTQVEVLGKQSFPAHNAIFRSLLADRLPARPHGHSVSMLEPAPPGHTPAAPTIPSHPELEEERVPTPGHYAHTAASSPRQQDVEEVEEATSTISPALLAWGRLPNLNPHELREPEAASSTWTPKAPSDRSEEPLLPSDIAAFIDAHNSTSLPTQPHWRLRNIDPASQEAAMQEAQPVDPQSTRADHLVERWFERWGEQTVEQNKAWKDQRR